MKTNQKAIRKLNHYQTPASDFSDCFSFGAFRLFCSLTQSIYLNATKAQANVKGKYDSHKTRTENQ